MHILQKKTTLLTSDSLRNLCPATLQDLILQICTHGRNITAPSILFCFCAVLAGSTVMPRPNVPPGQSPPFQVVDDLHHGAWIIIATALGLVLSLASFLIRLYVRLALNPSFGHDDYVFLGAMVRVNAGRVRWVEVLTVFARSWPSSKRRYCSRRVRKVWGRRLIYLCRAK